jgi:6-phosphogluconolactonase
MLAPSATILIAMENLSRRDFIVTASAATLATATLPAAALPAATLPASASSAASAAARQRVFVGSGAADGILAFDWDGATGELTAAGVAAKLTTVDWIVYSHDRKFLYAASEVDSFNGKPTGGVASYVVDGGKLLPASQQNSAGKGTCHIALDRTGKVLVSADYGGGSAASFQVAGGALSQAVWTEHYTAHGPNTERQQSAHAHFASYSPDNRFAYINDLGGDCIHIYSLDAETAKLTPAGTYNAKPGAGPRTLHFHPNGHTAYSVNELVSVVDVLEWHKEDGSLSVVDRIPMLPDDYHGITRACDTVITKDGRFVYFANRDKDFLYSFHADVKTGALTAMSRSNCGGKIPRNFVLDPTERWMLVANQDSGWISVFARNPETGVLAETGKNFPAATPMCILFG